MKKIRLYLISIFFAATIALGPLSYSYTFGIFTQSKTAQEILDIESTMVPRRLSTIAVIYDNYQDQGSIGFNNLITKLGIERNYHITLSPRYLTAKQVADGEFDHEYRMLFEDIKTYNAKVIFRTMHEMNGGRYPRSNDPENFKKARVRIWNLSREVGIDKRNIQFNFSLNIHDMPALRGYEPNQSAKLLSCTPRRKERLNCLTREDFYPGDAFVDIIGFSAYNRGKGNDDRKRLSFEQIIKDPVWNQRERISSYKKPIYIDEVGTTAVHYSGSFDRKKTQQAYRNDSYRKSVRLSNLAELVDNTPEIIGMNYFNVDYTNGLRNRIIGEADRKMIDPAEGMMYEGGRELLKRNDGLDVEQMFIGYKRNEKKIAKK